jgi:MFS family permease
MSTIIRPRAGNRRWPLAVLAVLAVALLAYMLPAYVPPTMSISRVSLPDAGHYVLLVGHIFTATVATLAALAQFWPWLRDRHHRLHRWTGRAYFFLGVFPSAVLILPVALIAPYGAANQSALLLVDVAWVATAVAGIRAARHRRLADHRRWMIRNYALTFSSLASRIVSPLVALVIVPQAAGPVYQGDHLALVHDIAATSIWISLAITVGAAEWYLQRRYGVPRRSAEVRVPVEV